MHAHGTRFVIASLLFLLGVAGAAPANALEIVQFTTASFVMRKGPVSGFSDLSGTFTAPPDYVVRFLIADLPNNFLECSAFPCRAGDSVFGHFSGDRHLGGSFTHAGQTIPGCDMFGRIPGLVPTFGPCSQVSVLYATFGPALLPEFRGDPTPRVVGEFTALLGAGIHRSDPLVTGVFGGSGIAEFNVVWHPETESWGVLSVEGHTVPEPATLLLFGTTAAGLGLTRWYRRRGREHAA